MPVSPRQTVAALVGAFLLGTVGGGILLAGGGSTASGTSIPFNPAADEEVVAPKAPKTSKAKGAFTAEAIKEGKRIVLSGDGAEPGATLVVQRKGSAGWQDFPASAKVSPDGSYSTYIITSRDGTYRLKDTRSDAASQPVRVDL